MNLQSVPISPAEATQLTEWFSHRSSNLFRDLVAEGMSNSYLEAIKIQSQVTERPADQSKFSNQAAALIKEGDEVRLFIQLFTKFSSPDHQFYRLKQL